MVLIPKVWVSRNFSNVAIKNKPFLGVPVTIKECIAVKGLPNTFGLAWRVNTKWSPAPYNSPRTVNLTGAGFIILGVTNNPELLMSWESDTTVYGRCLNPYDLGRTPGGSSSGEGAIVGAAGSVIGIGTDIGGSIRLPAYFCGSFGHKTTSEWIPAEPPHFLSPRTKGKAVCATSGPICRYAEDIAPFVSALIGRDIGDPRSVDLTKLRVVAIPDGFGWQIAISRVDPELRQAVVNVANYLGQQVVGKENVAFAKAPGQIALSSKNFGPMIFTGEPAPSETLGGEGLPPFNYKKELIPFIFGRSKHTFNSIMLGFFYALGGKRTRDEVLPFWNQLREEFHELLGENGVLIFPPHPLTTQPHGTSYFNPSNLSYTSVFNGLGFPVTQVPIGLSKDGLPIGVQVVARKHEDLKTIAVALQLEKGFGGWVPPRRFGVPIAENETEDLYAH
ncbi:Fatty-acid amide hydrolase 2 [Linderina pennispora]|nr:Fatty-acid amide hydrolase 2 [Linderina pennispora]